MSSLWSQLTVTGRLPPLHDTAAVAVGSDIVIFGGQNPRGIYSDMHVLSTITGRSDEISGNTPSSPVPGASRSLGRAKPMRRHQHSATQVGNEVYIFGGHNGITYVNDMQVYNTASKQWRNIVYRGHQPSARSRHSACLIGKRIYVFGGVNDYGLHQDLNAFDLDGERWVQPAVRGTPPPPRAGHASATMGTHMVIFGGEAAKDAYHNDTYTLNETTRSWLKLNTTGSVPEPRADTACAAVRSFLIVVGGHCGAHYFNDVHVLNIADCMWFRIDTDPAVPLPMSSAAAVLLGPGLWIVGGHDDKQTYNFVYLLNTEAVLKEVEEQLYSRPLVRSASPVIQQPLPPHSGAAPAPTGRRSVDLLRPLSPAPSGLPPPAPASAASGTVPVPSALVPVTASSAASGASGGPSITRGGSSDARALAASAAYSDASVSVPRGRHRVVFNSQEDVLASPAPSARSGSPAPTSTPVQDGPTPASSRAPSSVGSAGPEPSPGSLSVSHSLGTDTSAVWSHAATPLSRISAKTLELEAEVANLREQLRLAESGRRQAEETARTESARREAAEIQLSQLQAEIASLSVALSRAESETQAARREVEFEKNHSAHLEESVAHLQQELARVHRERADAESRARRARDEHEQLMDRVPPSVELQRARSGLGKRGDAEEAQNTIEMLRAQLEAMKEMAAVKITELRRQLESNQSQASGAGGDGDSEEARRWRARTARLADEVVSLRQKLKVLAAEHLHLDPGISFEYP